MFSRIIWPGEAKRLDMAVLAHCRNTQTSLGLKNWTSQFVPLLRCEEPQGGQMALWGRTRLLPFLLPSHLSFFYGL